MLFCTRIGAAAEPQTMAQTLIGHSQKLYRTFMSCIFDPTVSPVLI